MCVCVYARLSGGDGGGGGGKRKRVREREGESELIQKSFHVQSVSCIYTHITNYIQTIAMQVKHR